MRGRLSSHRLRRRALWAVAALVLVGAVVAGALAVGNTGRDHNAPLTNRPAQFYKLPPSLHLSRRDRIELFRVSSTFVQTAVARKRLDSAWTLLGPEMRQGQSRKSWDTGFNNVVPFPADGIQQFSVLYAYPGDVGIDLGLVHTHGDTGWAGKTFTIELKRSPRTGGKWLVAAWVPKGVGGGGTLNPARRAGPPLPPVHAKVSTKYLVAPFLFLTLLVTTLAAWGVRSAIRQRRAARRYDELLRYSSSSNPS